MLRALVLTSLLLQAISAPPRSSIVTRPAEAPLGNVQVVFYDDVFLISARSFGDRKTAEGSLEPGLFVHSKDKNRWLQVMAISTAGAKLGRSSSEDPQAQKKLRAVPVAWDFTPFATRPYIDQPLRTTGSIAFPDRIAYDAAAGRYELHYFSSWGVPSAETVLYIVRGDLVDAFAKR